MLVQDEELTDLEKKREFEKYGNRYYPIDYSYDKRVYENTTSNWFRIIGAWIGFHIFASLHLWGCFEFAVYDPLNFFYYNVAIMIATFLTIGVLLISGSMANKKKRRFDFLTALFFERLARKHEEEDKRKSEEEYNKRLQLI